MSKKNLDKKNRWRNVVVAFRMSKEESEELDNRVKMCGFRSKQDYLIQSSLYQKIVVVGNPLMLLNFRKNLQNIEAELKRIQSGSDVDEDLFTPIRTMLEIMQGYENVNYDNREMIAKLMVERIDVIPRKVTAEEKLSNLRQCMNKSEKGELNGESESKVETD